MKDKVNSRISKALIKSMAVLLVMIMTIAYLPQVSLADQLLEQLTANITSTDTLTEAADTTNPDQLAETASQEIAEEIAIKEDDVDIAVKVGETDYEKGVDLRNNPDYMAQLRELYTEEDIERLYAPRQWVIIPNVVGMTEADALRTMRDAGLVARAVYEDHGLEEEGRCIAQDIPAGIEWNTDASLMIWIQRKNRTTDESLDSESGESMLQYPEAIKNTEAVEPVNEPSQIEEAKD